ncbi:MAG: WG repeat-containing protein [Saprospiraceae bacterium]
MQKHGLFTLLFFYLSFLAFSQNYTGSIQWILPLNEKQIPIGKPATDRLAYRENSQIYLMDLSGDKMALPYDSISHEHHLFWKIWKNDLEGIYHLDSGEVIPPVYESITPISKSANNWAYLVIKYGMRAVVNNLNELVLPYTNRLYPKLKIICDTILEYETREFYYFSKNGAPVSEAVARLQKGPSFQRISGKQYVFTALFNGSELRDTFPSAEPFVKGIAVVKEGDNWGYFSEDGTWLISPQFQAAQPFNNLGHAVVKKVDKYGLIRKNSSFLIQPNYEFLKPFTNHLYEYKENGLMGLVDTTGQIILPPGGYGGFSEVGSDCFSAKSGDSLLVFKLDGRPIYIGGIKSVSNEKRGGPNFIASQTQPKDGSTLRPKKGLLSADGKWVINPVLTGEVLENRYFIVVEAIADPCCSIGKLTFNDNQKGKYLIFDRYANPLVNSPIDKVSLAPDMPFATYQQAGGEGLVAISGSGLPAMYDKLEIIGNGWVYVKKGNQYGAVKWID